jgi:hypothetical protein
MTGVDSTPGERNMNEYEVTFTNGESVEIEAWTPEAAGVIALEDAELEGRSGLSVVSVELLAARPLEL